MAVDAVVEARAVFNLKALRRHDPSIVEIVETASFVVLYNYNGEWTKTGVEGPMFLVRRQSVPYNGFFILNRNGVENFSADVTQDDDLEITPEFVIYRPESKGDNEVYGIWVFESSQRAVIGQKLLDLQQMLEAPEVQLPVIPDPPAPKQSLSNGKSTSKSKKAANKAQKVSKKESDTEPAQTASKQESDTESPAAPVTREESSTDSMHAPQISLDDLFGGPVGHSHDRKDSTAQSRSSSKEAKRTKEVDTTQSNPPSVSLLDSLFHKAASIVPFTGDSAEKEMRPALSTSPAPTPHANTLLSLLGVQSKPESPTTEQKAVKAEQVTESSTIAEGSNSAPKMSELVQANVKDRIGLGDDGQPLTRREFVTELLSMIHTDPDFVTELYKSYITKVS